MQGRMFLRSRSAVPSFALWVLIIAGYLAISRGIPNTFSNWIVLAISALAGAAASVLVVWIGSIVWVALTSQSQPGVLGEHEFVVRDDGLFEKTIASETLTRWTAIRSVYRSSRYLHIESSPGHFHLIPSKAFPGYVEFESFCSEIERRVK